MKKETKTYSVFLKYDDREPESFMEMKSESLADVMMAARGWLMCSLTATRVVVYDEEGWDVASYVK